MIKQSMVRRELVRISLGNVYETLSDNAMKLVLGGSGPQNTSPRWLIRCENGNSFVIDNEFGCGPETIIFLCGGYGSCNGFS